MAFEKIKIAAVLCLLFGTININGQSNFMEWSIEESEGDTIKRGLESSSVYDYFMGLEFEDTVLDFSDEPYVQVLSLNKVDHSGYLKIYFKEKLIFRYEVLNGKISGIGYKYDYKTGRIELYGLFYNSRLNGPLVRTNLDGSVAYIVNYRKGKFKKYIYHYRNKSEEDLMEFSEKHGDPMEMKVIK